MPSVVNLDLPCPLTSLYDNANRDMSLEELQEKAERVFEEILCHKPTGNDTCSYINTSIIFADKYKHRRYIDSKLSEWLDFLMLIHIIL